jgi:hypothetical protein
MSEEKIRWSKVDFPADADPSAASEIEVFVNGIQQKSGDDYEIDTAERTVFFFKPIRKEAKLSGFRWFIMFIGIAGSYKQNDSVDIVCQTTEGTRKHHVNLPIEVLVEPTEEQRGMLVGSYSPGG